MGSMAGVAAFLLLILAVAPAYATDYTVGDTSGWTSGSDYTTWASDKTFKVGDSLLFSYGMLHSVSEVSKSDYDACSAANSVQTYSDGSTTIKLTAPGTRYFICGTVGHCSSGMKLAVNVASGSGSTDSPPSTGSGSTDSPPPSSGSGSTDSPPSAGSGSTDSPPSAGSGSTDTPSTGSGSTDTPPSAGSGSTDTPSTGSGSGSGTSDAPSTGSGSDDSPSAGSGSGDAPAAGSGNDSPSSTTPATTPGSSVSNVPSTHSTTTPSGKTTPTTSVNAAAGSGFRAAGGVMAGVTALLVGVVAFMG